MERRCALFWNFELTVEWLKRWEDDYDEKDMRLPHLFSSTTSIASGGTAISYKGKEQEK